MTRLTEKMFDKKNTKKSSVNSKTNNKRVKKQDPPSDIESESESEYVDTSDSSYVPPRKNKKLKRSKERDHDEYVKFLSTIFPSKELISLTFSR